MRDFLEMMALMASQGERQWGVRVVVTVSGFSELRLQKGSPPRVRTSLDVLAAELRETSDLLEVVEAEVTEAVEEEVEAQELVEVTERTEVGRIEGSRSMSSRSIRSAVGECIARPSTIAAWRRLYLSVTAERMSPSAVMWRRGGREERKGWSLGMFRAELFW